MKKMSIQNVFFELFCCNSNKLLFARFDDCGRGVIVDEAFSICMLWGRSMERPYG